MSSDDPVVRAAAVRLRERSHALEDQLWAEARTHLPSLRRLWAGDFTEADYPALRVAVQLTLSGVLHRLGVEAMGPDPEPKGGADGR